MADEKGADDGFTVVRSKHNPKQTETRVEVKQADLEDTSTKAEGKFMLQFSARQLWLTSQIPMKDSLSSARTRNLSRIMSSLYAEPLLTQLRLMALHIIRFRSYTLPLRCAFQNQRRSTILVLVITAITPIASIRLV